MIDNNWSNFQLRRESRIQDCIRFTLIRSVIGLKKLEPIRQRIRVKTKTNHDFIARVFPRSMLVVFFCFEFFLASGHISFNAIDHCDYFGFGIRNSIEKCPFACNGQSRKKKLKITAFQQEEI